jgi:hypothetical protein
MLIRYGLVHLLAFLAGVGAFVGVARLGGMLAPPSTSGRREGFEKLLIFLSLSALLAVPVTIWCLGTIVRVVEDGSDGSLTWRRYLMFGSHAATSAADGARIEIANEPGEITVNATKGPLIMEPVQYGGYTPMSDAPQSARIEPGGTHAFTRYPIFLGKPADSVKATAGSEFIQIHIERAY